MRWLSPMVLSSLLFGQTTVESITPCKLHSKIFVLPVTSSLFLPTLDSFCFAGWESRQHSTAFTSSHFKNTSRRMTHSCCFSLGFPPVRTTNPNSRGVLEGELILYMWQANTLVLIQRAFEQQPSGWMANTYCPGNNHLQVHFLQNWGVGSGKDTHTKANNANPKH